MARAKTEMPEHATAVVDGGDCYYVECLCGWESKPEPTEWLARKEARRHEDLNDEPERIDASNEGRVDDPCENHPGRQAIGHTIDGVGLCRECAPSLEVEVYGSLFDQEHVELTELEVQKLGRSICQRLRNAPAFSAPHLRDRGVDLDAANIDGIIATLKQQARSSDEAPYDTPPLSAPFLRNVVRVVRRLRTALDADTGGQGE